MTSFDVRDTKDKNDTFKFVALICVNNIRT